LPADVVVLWSVLLSAVVIVLRWPLVESTDRIRWRGALFAIASIIALYLLAPFIAFRAMHLLFLSVCLVSLGWAGGRQWLSACLPSLLLLSVAFGLPSSVEAVAIDGLVRLTRLYGEAFASMVCGPVAMTGQGIRWASANGGAGMDLVITSECSGYRSMVGMLLLSLCFVSNLWLTRRGRLTIILVAVAAALLGNMVRLLVTLLLHTGGLSRFATGGAHAVLGNIVLTLEVLMLWWVYRKMRSTTLCKQSPLPEPPQFRPMAILWVATGCLVTFAASAATAVASNQQPGPYEQSYQQILQEHGDAPELRALRNRLAMVDELVDQVLAQLEVANSESLDGLLAQVGPKDGAGLASNQTELPRMTGAALYFNYQPILEQGVALPDLDQEDLNLLRQYYSARIATAVQDISDRARFVMGINQANRAGVVELCLVLPLLHTPDDQWSVHDTEQLPAWLSERNMLDEVEAAALRMGRPSTAYQFSEHCREGAKSSDGAQQYLQYLRQASLQAMQTDNYRQFFACMGAAVAMAEARSLRDHVVELRKQLAEGLADMKHPGLAADQMKLLLESDPDHREAGSVVMLRLKYLYAAKQFERIAEEAQRYQQDEQLALYRPRLLYMLWVSQQRLGQQLGATETEAVILRDYPDDDVAADVHFAHAMEALARSDYTEAQKILDVIIYRHPKSRLVSRAQELQKRLRDSGSAHAAESKTPSPGQ
jgi:exosortase/archaeosortase family protein